MDTFWITAGGWWAQAAVSGGAVLLLGWLGTLAFRRPAVRQQIAAWAVRGAVLAAALSALPHWVLLPRPSWLPAPEPETAGVEPSPPVEVVKVELAPPPVPEAVEPEPEEWVFIPWAALRHEVPVGELPLPEPTPMAEPAPPVSPAPEATDTPPSLATAVVPLLLSAYGVVAGVMLLQLLWERLALAWLLRDASPLVGRARWVWDRLTVDEPGRRAVTSGRVRTPLCVGFFRPLVVLPKRMADSADADTLRWVLAHELDHVRCGDTRTAHWVGVARAVYFFLPWFWAVRRDLNLSQEFLADAAAACLANNPADYAAFLVDLSGGRTTRRPIAAARMRAGKSDLFRRVHMLLNVKTATRGVSRGLAAVAGTAAIAAAVSLSGLGFADEPKKDAPKKVIEKVTERLPDAEDVVEVKVIVNGDAVKKDPAEVKERVIKLIQQGKVDEAKEVLEQLAKADAAKPKGDAVKPVVVTPLKRVVELPVDAVKPVQVERMRLQPKADVVRQAPRVVTGSDNDLRAQYERQLKEFDESIKKAKDDEAKEQLEKARDEYKKAMQEPLKKADEARKEVDAARKKLDEAERANRFQNDAALKRLTEMQKDMEKRLFDDLKKLEGFEGLKGLEGRLFNPEDLKKLQGLQGLQGLRLGGDGVVFGPDGLFVPGGARNVTQPRLGVRVEKVSAVLAEQLDLPKDSGVVIADVVADSPAAKAGLKKNDVLLTLADKDVPTDPEAFTAMVGKLKAGEKISAVVLRKGKKETVKGIELPEAKKPARGGDFGEGDVAPGRLGGQLQVGPGGANESVQIQINDGDVTLQATVDGVGYTVTGTAEKGKLVPAKVVIKDGKESKEYESLEKVPEGHRATVERLMGKVRVFGK